MIKRVVKWVGVLAFVLVLAAFGYGSFVTSRLAEYQAELKGRMAAARAETGEAERLTQPQDLRVVLDERFLNDIFGATAGLEIRARGGHDLQVEKVEVHLDRGFLHIEAEGVFSAFGGLYVTPVKASYLGFARIGENGHCILESRLDQVRADRVPLISPKWVESWMTLKLQRALKFPELPIPVTLEPNLSLPEMTKFVPKRNLNLRIPARTVQLELTAPWVAIEPGYLVIGVERIQLADREAPSETTTALGAPDLTPGSAQVAVRFGLISAMLDELVEPEVDLYLQSDRIPRVWRKEKKILGVTTKAELDLVGVDGSLDIQRARLGVASGELWVDLEAGGKVTGVASGDLFGLALNKEFAAEPRVNERVPVEITERDGFLELGFAKKEFDLDLKVETSILDRDVSIHHELEISPRFLLRTFSLDHWIEREIMIPTVVRNKRVQGYKKVAMSLSWSAQLPQAAQDHLSLMGTLAIGGLQEVAKPEGG
ncbi:hypothetical protein SCOR_25880 [Sulfidibacter corallicola]|uniref:Uncharacterized protein n=1 Tax=Sulfidibacter corallicola TaxID=2818388 RepID=A0A8A4U0A1_SULCO|nr:hypothetical protein [Sulfidibacter corallicola]QTD52175.1 hypothetical protein J3U87_06840 [Sulfidibacter corallicola]